MPTATLFPILLFAAGASADTLTIPALQDNTLFFESGHLSNGAGNYLFAGTTAFGAPRRALLAFDVAASIPAGSTIVSAALVLRMTMTNGGTYDVSLHRSTASWGESTSNATAGGGGGGAPAAPGDATWQHRFYPLQAWRSLGGDLDPLPSATTPVSTGGFYTWGTTTTMVADVQSWLDAPAGNAGWILVGDESVVTTAKRFDSRTSSAAGGVPPELRVTFTPPALGTSVCTPGSAGVVPCPCANPPSGSDRGCDNSTGGGGASLAARGVASLAADSVRFSTAGELATAFSIVLQGATSLRTGAAFGEGVRCAGSPLVRLHLESAVAGSIVYPDGNEPAVSAQSALLGDPLSPGATRLYQVYYRDPSLPCAGEPNFNATQALSITWGL